MIISYAAASCAFTPKYSLDQIADHTEGSSVYLFTLETLQTFIRSHVSCNAAFASFSFNSLVHAVSHKSVRMPLPSSSSDFTCSRYDCGTRSIPRLLTSTEELSRSHSSDAGDRSTDVDHHSHIAPLSITSDVPSSKLDPIGLGRARQSPSAHGQEIEIFQSNNPALVQECDRHELFGNARSI